jgi:superfamily II DNA/RNA helicase
VTAKTFRDLGVDDTLCDALDAKGITHPFPIQELALPLALEGNDLIGQARTGTGKTLAFGLPLLQRMDTDRKTTQALVIVPTRELCLQVHDDLQVGEQLGITTISVYGGTPYEEQTKALTSGVHVVVGTPGRLLDHLNRGTLDLSEVTTLVLDEADEMLDMGFLPDVERLIEACNPERHGMLFSATMPTEIVKLARRYLTHPTFTRADTEQHETAPNVEQHFFSVHRMDKPRVLARILQSPNRGGAYVFVRTKMMADRLVGDLEDLGIPAVPVHGDLRQQTREKNLDRFRSGKADVLVCTEVAARGIDVSGVTHVINYDCPDDEKMYLHRIGRTARAGAAGVAVTFAEFNEADRLNVIRKAVGATDTDVKQIFSTSDELTSLFDLPAERPWDHLGERSSSKGDRGRGSSAGGGSRRGQTDGRSKNRSEKKGGESARPRARARARAPEADTTASSERKQGDDSKRGGDSKQATRDEQRTSGGTTGESTRTRTRTRSRSRGEETSGGGTRETERRSRDTDRSPRQQRDDDTPDTTSGTSGRTRARKRASSGGARDSESAGGESGGDQGRSRGGSRSSQGPQGRSSGSRGSGSGGRGSGSGGRGSGSGGRGSDSGGRGSGSGGRGSGSGGRGSGRGRGSGGSGSGGDDRSSGPGQQVARKGRDARGEGEPHLARRVHVDHLP